MSDCIRHLSTSHSPVFLINSCLDLFSAPRLYGEDPFSRSYGVNLPSSLTMNLSSALVYSTRPPVSVCGTGDCSLKLSGFSREHGYRRCRLARGLAVLSGLGTDGGFACRPFTYPPSTRHSVGARAFHFSVSASQHQRVAECSPLGHRHRRAALA